MLALRARTVNTSLTLREKMLTSRLLTAVNKVPAPLTLRGIVVFAPTQLRLLSDCKNFCTFVTG